MFIQPDEYWHLEKNTVSNMTQQPIYLMIISIKKK